MAQGLLKMEIVGNLGADSESVGDNGARFSVAATKREKERSTGEWVEKTYWVSCMTWGSLAEKVVLPYAKKGTKVYASGEFSLYEADTGKSHINLNVRDLVLLSKDEAAQSSPNGATNNFDNTVRQVQTQLDRPVQDDDDDLPF